MPETVAIPNLPPTEAVSPAFALGVAASAVVHAGLLVGLIFGLLGAPQSGGGGVVLEAISVELVAGSALEARPDQKATASAAASASVADSEGAPAAAQPAAATAEPAPPEIKVPARSDPPPLDLATLALAEQAPAIEPRPMPEPPEPPPEPARTAAPETTPATPPNSAASGGATARASDASPAATRAQAGATPGEVNRYNVAVSRAINLAMRKLASSGRRGVLTVVFTVDADGSVVSARVDQGSGDSALDSHVLRLVRAASFPEPPARMTEVQRTYAVPVRVR